MTDEEKKVIEYQIAHFKDLARTYYRNRPYIQIEDEDVIYKNIINLFEKLLSDYKKQDNIIKSMAKELTNLIDEDVDTIIKRFEEENK